MLRYLNSESGFTVSGHMQDIQDLFHPALTGPSGSPGSTNDDLANQCVVGQYLGARVHVVSGFKDGVVPDINEISVGYIRRVCTACDLLDPGQEVVAFHCSRLGVQTATFCMICPDVAITLLTRVST